MIDDWGCVIEHSPFLFDETQTIIHHVGYLLIRNINSTSNRLTFQDKFATLYRVANIFKLKNMNKYTQLAEELEKIKKGDDNSLMRQLRLGTMHLMVKDAYVNREITIFEYRVLLREIDEKPSSAEHPFLTVVSPT